MKTLGLSRAAGGKQASRAQSQMGSLGAIRMIIVSAHELCENESSARDLWKKGNRFFGGCTWWWMGVLVVAGALSRELNSDSKLGPTAGFLADITCTWYLSFILFYYLFIYFLFWNIEHPSNCQGSRDVSPGRCRAAASMAAARRSSRRCSESGQGLRH